MPTYLHHAFRVPLLHVGGYALLPWIATFLTANSGGWLSDWMLAKGMPTTVVRKTMQTASYVLGAAPLLILPSASAAGTAIAILCVAASATGLSFSAVGVNHLDVGPSYAGILMGISNTFATIPGIIGVAAAGFIVEATHSFAAVFYLIAAVDIVGMAFYLAWASGDKKL
jgi:hypothetical protein